MVILKKIMTRKTPKREVQMDLDRMVTAMVAMVIVAMAMAEEENDYTLDEPN